MGINLFARAATLSYDFGGRGMLSTMRALEERGLVYARLDREHPGARSPTFVATPGGQVGLVNACTSVALGSAVRRSSSLLPGRPEISPLHANWTYKVAEERHEHLEAVGAAAGIAAVRETWLSREAAAPGDPDGYRFMHMRFEPVGDTDEEGIELSLFEPDHEAVLDNVREAA